LLHNHLNEQKITNPESPLKNIDLGDNAENLRFRYMLSKYPSYVIMDSSRLWEVSRTVMYIQEVAVQRLPPGQTESKKNRDTIVSFFQRLYPSTLELGDKFEMCIEPNEELDTLRNRLTELTGCENVCLMEADRAENISVLNLKGGTWHRPRENVTTEEVKFKPKVRSIQARDGLIVIFRDNNEQWKELTEEERKNNLSQRNSIKRFSGIQRAIITHQYTRPRYRRRYESRNRKRKRSVHRPTTTSW